MGFAPHEQSAADAADTAAGGQPAVDEQLPPTLAYGAKGDVVVRLKNLLRVLGYDVARNDELGEDCLAVVRQAQEHLAVEEPPRPDVLGELVGPATWGALYEAAAAKLQEAGQPA